MTNVDPTTINHTDHQPQEPTTNETNLPQLDGIYSNDSSADQMDVESTVETILHQIKDEGNSSRIVSAIPQLDGTVDDQVNSPRFAFDLLIHHASSRPFSRYKMVPQVRRTISLEFLIVSFFAFRCEKFV